MTAPILLCAGAVKTAVERLLEAGLWQGPPPLIHLSLIHI